jgi:hypothetical protein
MNFKIINRVNILGVCSALGAAAALCALPRLSPAAEGPRALTGTWRVQVQQYDCASDASIGMPFESFLTFGADRTLIETTANSTFEAGQRSPGHGFWHRTGRNDFRAVSEALNLFSSPARGPIPALAAGRQRIDQNIEYAGGDRFESDAKVEFEDASGTVLHSGCAKASATRME